ETVKGDDDEGYKIYIKDGVPLNTSDKTAYEYLGITAEEAQKSKGEKDMLIRDFMCKNFYDIRTFGAVMTTFVKAKLNCGQVRGPVQIGFARSIDPIVQQEVTITRVAITTEEDFKKKETEMGRKHIIPYALYRAEGYISANLASRVTGFSEEDLELLWDALINMFEHDHSAARGKMNVRELIVFKHDSELGNVQAFKLFDTVAVKRLDQDKPPRSYSDYKVSVNMDQLQNEVQCIRMI
ncbi:MAG: type I-C CRISPR-associated protein Cas7/Csd2, partial [Clostridiales bacterium]|nr:type I-C CRISPR-associated protein Cas7/Csd2 [Clostridiales bacterium]